MRSLTDFALTREMDEGIALLQNFDPSILVAAQQFLAGAEKIFLTGEGSSRIFPAKNLLALALQRGLKKQLHSEGARQAAHYHLHDWRIIALSNSGQTKEVITLLSTLDKEKILGITAAQQTPLHDLCAHMIPLVSGQEKATAATKTVLEQALILQTLLLGDVPQRRLEAASVCAQLVAPTPFVAMVATACSMGKALYFSGENNGVAEELALKANEIVRTRAQFLEGTMVVHGVEEVMTQGDVLLLFNPHPDEQEKIQREIADKIGVQVLAFSHAPTLFPTWRLPPITDFDGYIQLVAGWRLLAATGCALGIDIDRPTRARKIGNAI